MMKCLLCGEIVVANTRHKRIGIPRALTYFVSRFDWKIFFEILGCRVELSEPTTRHTFIEGFKVASNDQCLPVKIFYGHVIELAERRVDWLFIPQWVSLKEKTYGCPQVIGAPLLAKHIPRDDIPPVLMMTIDQNEPVTTFLRVILLALKCSRNPVRVFRACRYFAGTFEQEALPKGSITNSDSDKKIIGIIGRDYVLGDPFLSIDLVKRIKNYGFDVLTSASYEQENGAGDHYFKCRPVHWYSGRKMVACAHRFMEDERVHGVIFMNYFGCGMDAFVEEIFKNDLSKKKPYLCLSLDEHTGEAGIITRLEAFTDMIRRKGSAHDA